MTDRPHVPRAEHRLERVYEVPNSPEQVWNAIATDQGISAWMMPTRLDPRIGGEVVFDAGDFQSVGTVTQYTPNERFAYEEPWPVAEHILERYPQLADVAPDSVTPIATEFLVETASGGSCVIRVVTSAYGTGADWENEYFAEMMDDVAAILDKLPTHLNEQA